MAIVSPERGERFTIALRVNSSTFKIIQIFFHTDGSLFINFPYYQHSSGLVAVIKHPGGESTQTLSLEPGGKVVSHLVKYSHHPDGRAHFSQDGRVMSVIRKPTLRLDELEGHLFTVQLQDVMKFDKVDLPLTDRAARTIREFQIGSTQPEAIKIVGYWHPLSNLVSQVPDGRPRAIFLLSPPEENPMEEHVLLLSCEAINRLTKEPETVMIFIGAFDDANVIKNPALETSFLVFIYPAADYDVLKERLGSADYIKP